MKNNYLLLVTNKTLIPKLSKESNITFLFPVEEFTVGFPNTFKIEEIREPHAYLFVNRLLDNEGIESFKSLLKDLPSNIEGIVFDDIGILQILKENTTLKKILFLNHFNCNYKSINTYLEYVDSVVVSTDITDMEVSEFLEHAINPLVLYTFGHVSIMYSRRQLITNYNEHFKKNVESISTLTNDLGSHFKIVENKYGTVIYTDKPFNGLRYREKKNVWYHLINTLLLSDEEILEIIHKKDNLTEKYPYTYLSESETIVRIKER